MKTRRGHSLPLLNPIVPLAHEPKGLAQNGLRESKTIEHRERLLNLVIFHSKLSSNASITLPKLGFFRKRTKKHEKHRPDQSFDDWRGVSFCGTNFILFSLVRGPSGLKPAIRGLLNPLLVCKPGETLQNKLFLHPKKNFV